MIWALTSDQAGDNAQVLALAEELGLPFDTKPVRYTWRRRLAGNNRRISLSSIDRESRERLVPPWPDLMIIAGPRGQPLGRYVKRASGGRTILVLIGRPRVRASSFDLIFDTRQYRLPNAPNIRLLPLVMSRYRAPIEPTEEERTWIDSLPRPHLLLMIGGPIRYWNVTPRHISSVIAHLLARAGRLRGSLIVIGSPRTPRAVLQRARRELDGVANAHLADAIPRFQILMQDADELFPTGDSVSMISESVITGKPVGIIRPHSRVSRMIMLGPERRMAINPFRDLRRFWTYLQRQGLAGTIEEPVAGMIDNPVVTAAAEVQELLRSLSTE